MLAGVTVRYICAWVDKITLWASRCLSILDSVKYIYSLCHTQQSRHRLYISRHNGYRCISFCGVVYWFATLYQCVLHFSQLDTVLLQHFDFRSFCWYLLLWLWWISVCFHCCASTLIILLFVQVLICGGQFIRVFSGLVIYYRTCFIVDWNCKAY